MRLVRHLTFSNVIAVIALFIALGGAAYAGSKLDGKSIVNGSIGGGKLKNETITAGKIKKGTITGTQIAPGSIDSTQINTSTLSTVPSATTAQSATSAQTAASAKHAEEADNANHANDADTATRATEADSATTAGTATNATHAASAGEAETLDGTTAADLTLSCRDETSFYGGMCWDDTPRPPTFWVVALSDCAEEGGRLPSIGELIAYVGQEGVQFVAQAWSSDVDDVNGTESTVLTSNETERGKKLGLGLLGFRCVFPLTN